MKKARIILIAAGIVLPYVARLIASFFKGAEWFASYLDFGVGGFLFFEAFNAVCWGAILAVSFGYRHPAAIWFPAVPGFAFVALGNAFLDLSASSTSAIALVFIPIYALPLVLVGWLAGLWYDRRLSQREERPFNTE